GQRSIVERGAARLRHVSSDHLAAVVDVEGEDDVDLLPLGQRRGWLGRDEAQEPGRLVERRRLRPGGRGAYDGEAHGQPHARIRSITTSPRYYPQCACTVRSLLRSLYGRASLAVTCPARPAP